MKRVLIKIKYQSSDREYEMCLGSYFSEFLRFFDVTEHVFNQSVKNVQTMNLVASSYRQIETD